MVYPCIPDHFHYIKVGFKGVYITRTCFHDVLIGNFVLQHTVSLEMFARTLFLLIFANSLPPENVVLTNKESL